MLTRVHPARLILALAGVFLMATIAWYALFSPQSVTAAVEGCDQDQAMLDSKIECWLGIVRDTLRDDGLAEAMRVFREIYDTQPAFANSGCHRHAHRVGDMVYYEHFLAEQDLTKIEFPPETGSCGFGFFHGFLEHLIQDHPSAEFITETCDYLDATLTPTMGDMRITCYHGSGHGLALATAERVPMDAWGEASVFIDEPLQVCESLPAASAEEIEECQEGVFNVLVDWMETDEYGFSYDANAAFALCEAQPRNRQHACYYEMAMKVDRASGFDPRGIARIAESIESTEFRDTVFKVGVGGLVQHVIADGTHEDIFSKCTELARHFMEQCAASITDGLFEHGRPRFEYEGAREFCSSEIVRTHAADRACWKAFAGKLRRFYDDETARVQCTIIPESYRQELCAQHNLI